MNFEKIYMVVRDSIVIGSATIGTAGFYAFVIAGLCRIAFKLEENTALIWIGGPLFVAIAIWSLICLPKHLRKAGFIN